MTPPRLQEFLARELARGERVRWTGRPAPLGRVLASWPTFVFGVFWSGFTLFSLVSASNDFGRRDATARRDHWFASFWSIPFVTIGISMLLSPAWAWWTARRTLYAVTDRRALVIEAPLRRVTVQSFGRERSADAIRREDPGGGGDLVFEREASQGTKGRTVYRDVGFFDVANVRAVHGLLLAEPSARRDVDDDRKRGTREGP